MKSRLYVTSLCLLLALTSPLGAGAAEPGCPTDGGGASAWDATGEFSTTANPHGVWTYGYSPSAGGAVTVSPAGTQSGLPIWSPAGWGWGAAIFNNQAANVTLSAGLVIAPGELFLHPASDGRKSVLRFTAPQAACYQASTSFLLVDLQGGSVDVSVYAKGQPLSTDAMAGVGDSTSVQAKSVFLNPCDTVETFIGFGANGMFFDDSVKTAFAAAIVHPGIDTDGDGSPDACPDDTDGDGVIDTIDPCPAIGGCDLNFDGCPDDGDGDGASDCADGCPGDPTKTDPGTCGCGAPDDVDECALGTGSCGANATCQDTACSFSCACNAGYEGDGTTCADVDECAPTVQDTFDGTSLDPSVWTQSGSQFVTVSGGEVRFGSTPLRNTITSVQTFAPPTPSNPIRLSGRVRLGATNTDGHFFIATRTSGFTDGTLNGQYHNALVATLSNQGDVIVISRFQNKVGANLGTATPMTISAGDVFDFLVVDSGTTMSATFTRVGGAQAGQTFSVSAPVSFSPGQVSNRIGFTNREGRQDFLSTASTGGSNNCDDDATCTNTPGSFTCACNVGFSGDGVTCTDVDECAANADGCDTNATCTNTPGAYTCACNAGYEGPGSGPSVIGAPPGLGTLRHLVTFEDGVNGWYSKHCGTVDCAIDPVQIVADAAAPSPTHVQQVTRVDGGGEFFSPFVPLPGGATYCFAGWIKWQSGGWPFIGIDKYTSTGGGLGENWLIGLGGYSDGAGGLVTPVPSDTLAWKWYSKTLTVPAATAKVRLKTELWDGAGKGGPPLGWFDDIAIFDGACPTEAPIFVQPPCADINECATNTDNCDANATCTNTTGSFTCACNAGYAGDGTTCIDIDECATNTDNCDANATCTNTPGSFTCACNAGYAGNGTTCIDIDECATGADNCGANAMCTNTPGSFSCACSAGYGVDSGPGNVVVGHDVNTFATNRAGANEATFAVNLATRLAGPGGKLLLYESNSDFERNFSSVVTNALTGAGFSVTVTSNYATSMAGYDAVFTSSDFPEAGFNDNAALIAFVEAGGGVYVAGGVGHPGGPSGEAAGWSAFLNHFGLAFANVYNGVLNVPITGSHPLFAGVSSLNCGNGQSILDLGTNADYGIVQTTNGGGAYAASTGTAGGSGCTDIDECATGTDNCDASATCTNTPGSFTCACNAGYAGNGVSCTDINECGATPASAPACSWNVGAQASVNELAGVIANPTGAWSYYYGPGSSYGTLAEYIAAPMILYSDADHTNDWYSQNNGYLKGYVHDFGANVPMVVSNTSPDPAGTNTVYGAHVNFAELLYHPGLPGSGGRYNTIRWTAPAAGTYAFDAAWRVAHGALVDVVVVKNHAAPALFTGRSPVSYVQTLTLAAGDTLDFALGLGNDFGSTTTGISIKVQRTDGECNGTCADANGNGVCDAFDISIASPCDANATCTNTPGSFTCACNAGYAGDGTTCCPDGDGDGECTASDNCPTISNADQLDSNGDGQGDACECLGVTCSAADPCHVAGSCDPATGACSNPAAANGAACNDANACTTSDACQAGTCTGGAPLDCDDGNVCTADACDPATGCVHDGAVAGSGNNYSQTVVDMQPLAYWSMDEASGAVQDGTGNGHHGAPQGAPQYGQPSLLPGGAGTAIRLQSGAGGSRFEVPAFDKFTPGSTGYTLSYWIKINSMPQGGSPFTQAWGDGIGGGNFYMMQYLQRSSPTTACPRPHYGANLGAWDPSPCTVGANLTVGQAQHVVVTWDRIAGKTDVWIDDQQFTLYGKPTGTPTQTALPLYLGYDNRETQAGWDITLDEVAFWNRPLTTTEVGDQNDTADTAAGTPCDDGNACTAGDTCASGSCQAGGAVACDDGNPCTVDACDPASGCTFTPGNAGTACRAAAGVCDVEEACDGVNAACPADGKASASDAYATYRLQDTLAADEPGRAPLFEIDPANSSDFETATVLGQAQRVWRFNGAPGNNGGLRLDAAGVPGSNYTIELLFAFDKTSGWRKIVDSKNRTADVGFYVSPSSRLVVYPGSDGPTSMAAGTTYHHVVLTYASGQARFYLNGSHEGTFNGTQMQITGGQLNLFLDDFATGTGEYTSGRVALVRLYGQALDAARVGELAQMPFGGPECRPATGACDVAERCDGSSNDCPADAKAAAGTACGNAASSDCDQPDTCDGGGTCLANLASNGAACSDGNACTAADTCASGACAAGPAVNCDDGNACSDDACDAATGCTYVLHDADGDSVCDDTDNCPTTANPGQANSDGTAPCGAILCNGYNFTGTCQSFGPGIHDYPALNGGVGNDTTHSVRVLGGTVELWQHYTPYNGQTFTGAHATFTADDANTDDNGIGGVSSLAVFCAGAGDSHGDACDNCPDAPNEDQADADGDGKGDVCDDCPFQGGLLANGASACADDGTKATCLNGELTTTSCGADTCSYTGTASTGGACAATDFYCESGTCKSTPTSGTDACGGTDAAPSATIFACNAANNACTSSTSTESDACSDDGDAYGGGSCTAVDWSCSGGRLTSAGTSGDDTCGGTAASPSVSYFTCSAANNACTANTTTESDACTDSGNAYGGGSCAATDWQCDGGVLASTSTSGTDTCGGTAGSPSITTYACNGDGNACTSATTTENDSCSDSGDAFGGGACDAVDWTCAQAASAPANCTSASFGGHNYLICQGSLNFGQAEAACGDLGAALSHVDSEAENTFLVDTALGAYGCGSFTDTSYWISNLKSETGSNWPSGDSIWAGGEPNGDGNNVHIMRYCSDVTGWNDVPTGYQWGYVCESAGPLGGGAGAEPGVLSSSATSGTDTCDANEDDPTVTTYACNADSNRCDAGSMTQHDSCTETGGTLGGGACDATDWQCAGGTLTSTGSTPSDVCVGDDQLTVTSYTCTASNGSTADTCTPADTTFDDVCADTGDAFGGGGCAASDWTCSGSTATLSETSGDDVCSGDDSPSVTYWSCGAADGGANDTCSSATTTRSDLCEDNGTASGGGTCNATNWFCDGQVLTSSSSSGTDSCGDGSNTQVDYFICQPGDGTAGDTCVAIPDVTPPDLTCPERVIADCTRFDGVHVDGVIATTGDICDDSVLAINDYNQGGLDASGHYAIGETTVTFTARDDAGNETTCVTIVEVQWTPWSFAVYAASQSGLQMHDGSVVSGEAYSGTDLQVHKTALLEGAGFAVGKAHVHKDATVTDGVYATAVTLQGNATWAGTVPANAPYPPALDTSSYDAAIASAAGAAAGNLSSTTIALGGGTVLVNGNATLKAGGTLSGPGTLVATGNITIEDGGAIGSDVTLIAGGAVHIKKSVTMAAGGLVYGKNHVHVHDGSVLAGADLISPNHVHLHKSVQVAGLVLGLSHVQVGEASLVSGSVISHGHVQLHKQAVVAHDCESSSEPLPPGVSQGTAPLASPPSDDACSDDGTSGSAPPPPPSGGGGGGGGKKGK